MKRLVLSVTAVAVMFAARAGVVYGGNEGAGGVLPENGGQVGGAKTAQYDVVVAGGGPSGIGAAYMAAKRGAKVLLLEKSGRLGGMAIQAMVSPFACNTESPTVGKIMGALRVGRTVDFAETDVLAYDLLRSVGADVLLHATVTGPTMTGNRVTGVEAFCAEGKRVFRARVVIDATGDGIVAAAAGVPFEIGRVGDGLVQPMSIMFTIGGIEKGKRVWCGSEEEARRWKLGSRTWEEVVHDEIVAGNLPPEVGVIRLYDGPNASENVVNATQVNRLFGVKSADLTKAEITCRKQAFQVVDVLKRHVPGYANAYVSGMPAVVGVRETRRFEGVERLEAEDCLSGRKRANAIARNCSFVIDIHNPTGAGQADQQDAYKTGEARRVKPYDIPYGAIVPKKIEGLLFCGRCLSASHEALASCRVMGCAMATGVGAGAAAAESVRTDVPLRDVKVEALRLFEADRKPDRP